MKVTQKLVGILFVSLIRNLTRENERLLIFKKIQLMQYWHTAEITRDNQDTPKGGGNDQ